MVGSKIINRAMGMIRKGELAKATMAWRKAHFGAVMSGSNCPTKGGRALWREQPPLQPLTPLHPRESIWMTSRGTSIHIEGYNSCIWKYEYPWQDRHLRELYAGPHAQSQCRAPAACLHCTDCHIWGVTPRFLSSVNLPEEPE